MTIYNELKNHSGARFGISVNFLEIWYNDEDKSENITDLLECSNVKEAFNTNTDFVGLTNVAIRSIGELEGIINIVKKRSRNWIEKRELNLTLNG